MKRKLLITLYAATYMYAAFAQGYFMEYKMTMDGANGSGDAKTYSQDGNVRSEVAISGGSFNKTITTLILKSSPNKVYTLNQEQKTYDEADITSSANADEPQPADYEVTVLGKEKVDGYNTTHVRMVNTKRNTHQEFWTTTEIDGYADYLKIKTKYTGKENFTKALAAKGALGFPVRIKAEERMGSIQLDLVKAARQNNSASLFTLDGYTKNAAASGNSGDMQQMIQKLQNMTPEERQKFIDQMKQQQGIH